ncbi:nitrous oxide reductase accessory protein NosL [Anoxybacillus sp. ST4]|uniref:nitrous oxide reductase accessory protein NosL n=1 Tax=Anoxybacillus sp. ST4 TaxID=2864181 RepID=UPI001C63EFF1|nr:nitrous oxide reductase accessory protein NosL [Anoxybacillus sp. ST4]MBW7651736.1 nitrous oxide reductase accessory protein NosL [Anoxybacillus sp. ST4]
MKKWIVLLIGALFFALAGCNNQAEKKQEETKQAEEKQAEQNKEQSNEEDVFEKAAMAEPDENTVCVFCNMKVYPKEHELGKFTAKSATENGDVLFFDDIGCLFNYERDHGEAAKKYVRDYNTLEWIELQNATVVKADIKTPMNYGYAFFAKKEDADKFVSEQPGAMIVSWEDVDKVAHERYMKKKQMMQNKKDGHGNNMDQHGHDNGDMKQDGHSHN